MALIQKNGKWAWVVTMDSDEPIWRNTRDEAIEDGKTKSCRTTDAMPKKLWVIEQGEFCERDK